VALRSSQKKWSEARIFFGILQNGSSVGSHPTIFPSPAQSTFGACKVFSINNLLLIVGSGLKSSNTR